MFKVKIFDEDNEEELEENINSFLEEIEELRDIKYQVSSFLYLEEQIYCFSAMIIYK